MTKIQWKQNENLYPKSTKKYIYIYIFFYRSTSSSEPENDPLLGSCHSKGEVEEVKYTLW